MGMHKSVMILTEYTGRAVKKNKGATPECVSLLGNERGSKRISSERVGKRRYF
jgi:hypothetical protein